MKELTMTSLAEWYHRKEKSSPSNSSMSGPSSLIKLDTMYTTGEQDILTPRTTTPAIQH
jgi:hypothetical protein